jgi:heterotetrameric sarcosine oxidase gamma subunit
MAENPHFASIENPRLLVQLQPQWHTASLRYFTSEGSFARLVGAVIGLGIPAPLGVAHNADDDRNVSVLAWRSPTETTLLTLDGGLVDALLASAGALQDGCVVDQRGGLLVVHASGPAVPDLLARKGGHGATPSLGESRRARFAEIAVSVVKIRADEVLLIVDRIYAPHLMAAIRASAADL